MYYEKMKNNKLIRASIIILIATMLFCIPNLSNVAHADSAPTASAQVKSKGGAYLRKKASTSSAKVTMLSDNARITINKEVFIGKTSTSKKNKWYHVSTSSTNGYIRSDLVDNITYTAVTATANDNVNYRTGTYESFKKKGTLKKGSTISVVLQGNLKGSKTMWYKFQSGSSYYYVSSKYVTLGASAPAVSTTSVAATANGPVPTTTPVGSSTDTTAPVSTTNVTTSGVTYPTSVPYGTGFALKGTVSANKTIEKVVFGVTDTNGNWVLSSTKTVNATSFNISKVDAELKFGLLSPGNYIYKGDVYVGGQISTPVYYSFNVYSVNGPTALNNTAITLAWPLGTAAATYAYSGGSAYETYKAALEVAYPSRSTWNAAAKVGASCDVFIGTVCRYCGYDKDVPRTLNSQWNYFATSPKWTQVSFNYSESDLKPGDIILYKNTSGTQHIFMYVQINGKGYIAEASYQKRYGRINTSLSQITKKNKTKILVYRANS